MHADSSHTTKSGKGLIIMAVVLLLVSLGFGIFEISQGMELRSEIPDRKEIQRREAYLELLEELYEILDEADNIAEIDVDALLDELLDDTCLTKSEQREIRDFYKESFELALEGYVEHETALNKVQREIIYYNDMPDPDRMEQHANRLFLIGGVSVGIGVLAFAGLLRGARNKRKAAAQQ